MYDIVKIDECAQYGGIWREYTVMGFLVTDIKKLCKSKFFILGLAALLFCAIYDPLFMSHTSYKYYENPFMWWMFMKTGKRRRKIYYG